MSKPPVRILAADIGGTNCRFALFRRAASGLSLVRRAVCASAGLCDSDSLLTALQRHLEVRPQAGDALALAVAGPVLDGADGQSARLTNGTLYLEAKRLRHVWGAEHCLLVNDFYAQAYACLSPAGNTARLVAGEGRPVGQAFAVQAVLGAGTGLGAASIAHAGGQWYALPSEFGHTAFPFLGAEEGAFHEYLCRVWQIPFASCEDVLSGRGLALLHTFLTGDELTPPEVGRTALAWESPTLQHYARFYARVCRHWILSTLCLGGLWITGGIAQANPLCLTSPVFEHELYACPRMADLVRPVPVRLLTDGASGLWGVAWALLSALGSCGSDDAEMEHDHA
ncbi:MAG: glucokinase [Desulfovibrionaceae bacterium]|nr:glucokinase [Desulfovibrionaceae bacterium]